jgi:hypothetical protein
LDNGRAADPVEIYIEELLPPSLTGGSSGFRRGGSMLFSEESSMPFSYGEFGIEIQLPLKSRRSL